MGWKITCRKQGEVGGEYRLPGADDPEILLNREGEETWRLCVTNRTQAPWAGVIRVEYHFPKTDPRFFMPAFLYGRNKGEWAANIRWYYPRLREGECRLPYAPWWMVRSDRLSHPSVFVFDGGRIRGISASPYFLAEKENLYPWKPGEKGSFYQYAGFGCSLEEGFLAYTIGYENAPFFFLNSDTVQEREALGDNCFVLQPGQTLSVLIRVYDCEAQEANALGTALEEVYWQYHEEPVKKNGRRRTVEDLSEAISRDAWRPEGKNYATQVYLKDDGSLYFNEWFSISWTGGAEVAVPMLMAGLRLGREDIREQAAECVENIVEHSLNPASGLPYDACEDGVWSTEGWWKDHLHARGHSSYLVGQAVYYILKGYEWEKRLGGRVHTNWLEFAGRVIRRMEESRNGDGEYPYIWSERTGAGLEYDSFAGAWCLASAAYYSWLTESRDMLEELCRSEKHYYDTWVKRMECYGTPLDTDKAVDSEGILAYLKAVRYLHELTGSGLFLDHMKDALNYEFSFKFCYNSPVQVPPLSKVGWSSCGGSVTSTCNPHIHPMSNNVADEMFYYLNHREDPYVRQRLSDTIAWGCQTYNTRDGEYDFGKKGWMSERFCHSQGLLVEHYSDGSPASTWFALLPWGASNIIEGLTGDLWERLEEENGCE